MTQCEVKKNFFAYFFLAFSLFPIFVCKSEKMGKNPSESRLNRATVSEVKHPMKQKKPVARPIVFSCLLLCLMALPIAVSAQPTITATKHQSNSGDTVLVSIKVTGYTKILSTQFTLNWDPSVIQLKNLSNFGLNVRVQDNFGRNKVADGEMTFFWYDPTLSGVNVSNDQPLFDMTFDVKGATGTCSTISFVDFPTVREVVDTSARKVAAVFTNGEVIVGEQCLNVRTTDELLKGVRVDRAFPNPSSGDFMLPVHSERFVESRIVLFDGLGRRVDTFLRKLNPGDQVLGIERNLFPHAGIYYIQIRIDEESYTQKLVVL